MCVCVCVYVCVCVRACVRACVCEDKERVCVLECIHGIAVYIKCLLIKVVDHEQAFVKF